MCLIFFSWKKHKNYDLVLVANRDEYYARPAEQAHIWPGTNLLAGKDLESKGTWLGLDKKGRFAALTNYRDPNLIKPNVTSRGALVTNYLENGNISPENYLKLIAPAKTYNPFNLLVGNQNELYYFDNVRAKISVVDSGIHGLSNAFIDSSWPKVDDGKKKLTALISENNINIEAIFEMMADTSLAQDEFLPSTGVPLTLERALSSKFIKIDGYGTRCTSIITIHRSGLLSFTERTYDSQGNKTLPDAVFNLKLE